MSKPDPLHVALVACGGTKLPHAAPAADLYAGDLFAKSRGWAERHADRWYVLSAKHGLVHPATVVEPYDERLTGKPLADRQHWALRVDGDLRCNPPHPDGDLYESLTSRRKDRVAAGTWSGRGLGVRVTVLAGFDYREFLVPLLRSWATVHVPMEGMGIGQQKAWLLAEVPRGQQLTLEGAS